MLHLYDFARIDLPSLDLLGRLKADETKAVAETFATNLRRVISLLHITPALVSVSAESLMAAEQAGEGAADGVGRMARVLAGQPLPSDVAERLFGRMRELAGADAATRKRNEYIAFHHAQLCLQLLGQFGHDYVPALLYSATVQTWSAFEVFCKDLWASLVNVRPKWAVGEYPDREPKQGGSEHGDKRQYSTLPFDVLSQFNFDLSRSFGSAMCEARKVAFDKPNDISESYASIFGKKNFSPVFDLYIGRLKCLCL